MKRPLAIRGVIYGLICLFWVSVLFLFLRVPAFISTWYGGESINILAAPGMFDASYVSTFEKETGIRVNVTHFEQTEELLVKLRAAGQADYDLIMPANYVVSALVQERLIKKLQTGRLLFWNRLYPALLNHHFDPENNYTIPYAWDLYGVAINRSFFPVDPEPSWDIIFEHKYGAQRIGMMDSARDVVNVGALYLFGPRDELHEDDIEQVYRLLKRQKPHVAVYTDLRSDYFLVSGTVTAAMAAASDIARAAPHDRRFRFLIPKEGPLVEIDSFAIPSTTRKEGLVYQFLNYVYRTSVMNHYVHRFGLFSALRDVGSIHTRLAQVAPDAQLFSKGRFPRDPIHPEQLVKLWVSLKS